VNPQSIYKKYLEAGEEWADKKAAYDLLDHSTKTVEADLTLKAKSMESLSMTEARAVALSSSGYRDHLAATYEAQRVANRAKIKLESITMWFDAARTAEASERAASRSQT
jgi:hypothetical protein